VVWVLAIIAPCLDAPVLQKAVNFEQLTVRWKADPAQFQIDVDNGFNSFYIFKPKIALTGFAESNKRIGLRYVFSKYVMNQADVNEIRAMFLPGVETAQMKQWLLYS
jgi:hypothetical protein